MLKLPGVARNPAPLGNDLFSRIPEDNRKWANNGGVLRLELIPDPVSKSDILPGSTHLGVQESYEVPKAWRDEYLQSVASPNPVQSVAGAIRYSLFSHTERDLLWRAVMDKERTRTANSASAPATTPSFTSESSLASDLNQFSRGTFAGAIADNIHLLPGRAGELGEAAKFGYQSFDFLHSTYESLDSIHQHPGDPASDWERASIGLNLYSLIGPGALLPGVAGGVATLGSLAKTFGEATRSRVLANRAEKLVNFGSALPHDASNIREEMESHYGYFSVTSGRYSAQGGWDLHDSNERLFERNSQSTLWANTQVRGLQTANGSEVSGIFRRSERREERGGSLFNLYEPTSATTTRRSYESYRVSFDGSRWGENAETKKVSLPAPPPTLLGLPKEARLPFHDELKTYPPPKTQVYPVGPRQPPPPPPAVINRPNNLGGISFRPRGIRIIVDYTNPPPSAPNDKPKE